MAAECPFQAEIHYKESHKILADFLKTIPLSSDITLVLKPEDPYHQPKKILRFRNPEAFEDYQKERLSQVLASKRVLQASFVYGQRGNVITNSASWMLEKEGLESILRFICLPNNNFFQIEELQKWFMGFRERNQSLVKDQEIFPARLGQQL